MALLPFTSQIIADTGISMGDEGKGRLIPEVIEELRSVTGQQDPVAVVLKVNGGSNSGHTVGGLKLNLIPGGVADKSVPILGIGAGVVADPRKFIWELAYLGKHGYGETLERLLIDERCLFSDVTHRLLDLAWENYRTDVMGEEARGSTGRGITPAFADEVGQMQIHYAHLRGTKEDFKHCIAMRCDRAARTIQHVCQLPAEKWEGLFDTLTTAEQRANKETIDAGLLPESEFDFSRFTGGEPFALNVDAIVDAYWSAGQKLVAQVKDLRETVQSELENGRYVVGEFGQSYWLDKRAGFPPNVTASHTFTPEIFQSAGIPVQPVHNIGCCKAYDTKVGTHVFLTKMPADAPLTNALNKLEFGTSTGRQRMVGWFDAVEKGDTLRYGGFQDLMLNKLDALSGAGTDLLICTAYKAPDGSIVKHVPRDDRFRKQCEPVYQKLPCWEEDISGVRSWADLPENARRYVATAFKAILEVAGKETNLRYIGVGPEPSQIIKDVPEAAQLVQLAL